MKPYKLILKELSKSLKPDNLYFKHKTADLELISLIISVEFKSIDFEYQLFRQKKVLKWHSKSKKVFITKEMEIIFHL